MSGTSRRNPDGLRTEAFDQWLSAQETLASTANLAIVTVGDENDFKDNVSNETSVCRKFLSDPEKSKMCAEYCGRARQRALAAGETISFRCGANLHCFASPLRLSGESSPRVLIGGRAFLSVAEYRDFVNRESQAGSSLAPEYFSNLKFTDNEEFQKSQKLILTSVRSLASLLNQSDLPPRNSKSAPAEPVVEKLPEIQTRRSSTPHVSSVTSEEMKAFFSGSFEESCDAAMRILQDRFGLRSAVLLIRGEHDFEAGGAAGEFGDRLLSMVIPAESPIIERCQPPEYNGVPVSFEGADLADIQELVPSLSADAFPLLIGEELTGILVVLDSDLSKDEQRDLAKLAQTLIVPLELARLKGELSDQSRSLAQREGFANLLETRSDAAETFRAIVERVAQALDSERVSLLVFNEEAKILVCKAAIGLSDEAINSPKLGAGISSVVLERGEPLLARHVEDRPWVAVHAHRGARTDSFISFPVLAGSRRLAVINVTDRLDEREYTEADLGWLQQFAPYVAAAIEKIDLLERAHRFEMLAITDPLTGLLNRRYLEERFAQEIERSKRYQFPLSFVMMDIDSFKSFNDTFGHQAGDEVLRETAHCIRRSLRNFDVAARYGGEEFIVVLPETDVTSATILAERLRKAVEQHFAASQVRRPVTVSIGVSSLSRALQNRHQVIKAADQALYAAKKRGKNCVVVYNTELVPGLN